MLSALQGALFCENAPFFSLLIRLGFHRDVLPHPVSHPSRISGEIKLFTSPIRHVVAPTMNYTDLLATGDYLSPG